MSKIEIAKDVLGDAFEDLKGLILGDAPKPLDLSSPQTPYREQVPQSLDLPMPSIQRAGLNLSPKPDDSPLTIGDFREMLRDFKRELLTELEELVHSNSPEGQGKPQSFKYLKLIHDVPDDPNSPVRLVGGVVKVPVKDDLA